MENLVVIILNFLTIWVTVLQTKPVPKIDMLLEECHNCTDKRVTRVRRSIPDVDAINPDYMGRNEVLPGPEQEFGVYQRYIGPSNLEDESKVFDDNKSEIESRNLQTQSEGLAKQEMLQDEPLNSDEQEECYRQQNIDSPADVKIHLAGEEGKKRLHVDVAHKPQPSVLRNEVSKSSVGRYYDKRRDDEITSLYSEPERATRIKHSKHLHRSKKDDRIKAPKKIYKPIGVLPQFPVYDEDIDFQPDPLQGILDDKYWQDQQDQEGVIKKYMDLATYNMMPSDYDIRKRDSEMAECKGKSVSSHEGFKDVSAERDRSCPCKDLVACSDCSKGKSGKKSNYTLSQNNDRFGRKLLSLDYEEDETGGHHIKSEFSSGELKYFDDDDPSERSHLDDVSFRTGRKLLALPYDGNDNEESYDYSEEDLLEPHNYRKTDFETKNYLNENLPDEKMAYKRNNVNRAISYHESLQNQKSVQRVNKGSEGAERFSQYSKPQVSEDPEALNVPEYNQPMKPAKYYVPNNWANKVQQIFKAKGTVPTSRNKVNTSEEFEMLQGEVIRNASLAQVTLEPLKNNTPDCECLKINGTTEPRQDDMNPSKGRRSYSEQSLLNEHVLSRIDQISNDAVIQNNENIINQTANVVITTSPSVDSSTVFVSSTSNSIFQTLTASATETPIIQYSSVTVASNTTVIPLSVTKSSHVTITTSSPKRKGKFYDEESMDAAVANDIVESVIEESQRSSLLENRLGLCRRNNSLNIKYGTVIPETEQVLRAVTDCLMKRLKDHLAKQSCIILEPELLEFLKWVVLKGESNKNHIEKTSPVRYRTFRPATPVSVSTCATEAQTTETTTCDPALEAPPPPDLTSWQRDQILSSP